MSDRRRRRGGAVRCYELALLPNAGKAEAARHAIWWATRLCLDYVRRLYWLPDEAYVSTAGRGTLDNQAQARARNALRAGRAAARATGEPFGLPESVGELTEAEIRPARDSSFAYWVKVPCGPYLPAQPHRAFSRALRAGAALRPRCEIRRGRRGGYVARVFVEYSQCASAERTRDVIGVDVGVNVGVATSDGRCSRSLRPILQRTRERNAERQRQGHRTRAVRSAIKQHLDREARRLVASAIRGHKTIAVETLRVVGNLKPSGSIGGWARRHFGERVRQIGEEAGCVAVVEVHPAYTSQTCPRCDHIDRLNRSGMEFRCVTCGYVAHADVIGARNVARKARGTFPNVWGEHKGRDINTTGGQVPPSRGA